MSISHYVSHLKSSLLVVTFSPTAVLNVLPAFDPCRESLTFQEIAATLERVTGVPAEHRPMTLEAYAALGFPNIHDVVNMLQFFIDYGLPRDYELLRKLHPDLMTFEQWLTKTGWQGEPGEVQKDAMTGDKK